MKDILVYLFLKLFCIKDRKQLMLAFSFTKLDTKEGTVNKRTHLHIIIKFIKKN